MECQECRSSRWRLLAGLSHRRRRSLLYLKHRRAQLTSHVPFSRRAGWLAPCPRQGRSGIAGRDCPADQAGDRPKKRRSSVHVETLTSMSKRRLESGGGLSTDPLAALQFATASSLVSSERKSRSPKKRAGKPGPSRSCLFQLRRALRRLRAGACSRTRHSCRRDHPTAGRLGRRQGCSSARRSGLSWKPRSGPDTRRTGYWHQP